MPIASPFARPACARLASCVSALAAPLRWPPCLARGSRLIVAGRRRGRASAWPGGGGPGRGRWRRWSRSAPVWQAVVWWTTGSDDSNLVMPWLAAVAGCLAAMAPSRWHLGRPWLVPVAAWALIVAVTWPVTAARELDFTIDSLGGLTGNGRLAPPPSGAAAAVAMAAEIQLVALLLFDWLIGAGDGDRRRVWRWLAPGIGGGVCRWPSCR